MPAHGRGMLAPAFRKGQSGNPSGYSPERLSLYHEAQSILAQNTPQAARRQVELMNSEDDRVAAMMVKDILDRAPLKPEQASLLGTQQKVDLSSLTTEERQTLAQLLQKALGIR
ncbi:MAG TPA: hypothetical protein VKI44_21465 [Acetobacteraceae bacterium]|nr:hypothetical protein [Acetobacteraceae bacterium]